MVDADRNLLFGILALQVDFVTGDDLIAAMQAWVREKHKALGQVLVERGTLSTKLRDLLEPMVDAHVERHGGDPARSLAALTPLPSSQIRSTAIDDPDIQASLSRIAPGTTTQIDSFATRPPEPGPSAEAELRFRVLRPHAKGGIGEVFVAHDRELNREVALKEIQGRHADDPDSRTRFLLEAEVTGRLEHPGIVPVYGLGRYPDGRPYYAMRFVRGDSLKEAIERFHRDEASGTAARALGLQKLLRRFLDVCDAMSYAHSRGVLHRDLKPGNIMLGKYGETLIVDWGLAKARGRSGPGVETDEAPLTPSPSSGSSETLPGSTIGTPAYMSPEQAAGDLDQLGPASDVYSLGATLYSVLTGRAPFSGDAIDVLRSVRLGVFPRPRSIVASVPPALEAICLKAMAAAPASRYATPRALSEDVERWLADEPVSAHRESWVAPAARFCRRHREAVVPVVALAAGLVVGWGLLMYYRARLETAEAARELDRIQAAADRAREADRRRIEEEKSERSREAARREARIREGFAMLDRAREARTARRPGWTWSALDALAAASVSLGGEPGVSRAGLRDEAVVALGSLDVRRRAILDPEIRIGWPAQHFAFSPDGRRLAAVGYRPSMRVHYSGTILDVETGSVVRGLRFFAKLDRAAADLEAVEDVAYSPDGRWLAVGTSSGRAHLWDLSSPSADGMPTTTWDAHDAPIRGVAFAGALFTIADDRELRRWEMPTGPATAPKVSHSFRATRSLEKALEVGDGRSILIVADGALFRLDPADLTIRERISADESRYEFGWALPGLDGTRCAGIKSWEVGLVGLDGAFPPLVLADPRPFRSPSGGEMRMLFEPTGSLMLATFASDRARGVRLWDLASGTTVATLPVRGHYQIGGAFSPDGRRLAVADAGEITPTGPEKKITLYEIRDRDVRSAIAHAGGAIRAFSVSPNGSSIACMASGSEFSAASAIEATTWETGGRRLDRAILPGRGSASSAGSASVAFHPAGISLVRAGNDTGLFTGDLRPTADRPTIDSGGEHPRAVFSGDGRKIWAITGGPGGVDRVVVVDRATGEVVVAWKDELSSIASGMGGLGTIAAAGDSVLVGGNDGSCYLFKDGEAAGSPVKWVSGRDPVRAMTLSRDGDRAAIGRQSGNLEVRRVSGGDPLVIPGAHHDAIGAVAFAPDGNTCASGSSDQTIRLWRQVGASWGDPLTLPAETGPVLSLAFSPDGRQLYALSEGEAAIRVWHLSTLRDRLEEIGLAWEGFRSTTAPQ